jgi:hypothetical protein
MGILRQKLPNAAKSPPAFDWDLAAKIRTHVAVKLSLCGHPKPQLAARLGSDTPDVKHTGKAKTVRYFLRSTS